MKMLIGKMPPGCNPNGKGRAMSTQSQAEPVEDSKPTKVPNILGFFDVLGLVQVPNEGDEVAPNPMPGSS